MRFFIFSLMMAALLGASAQTSVKVMSYNVRGGVGLDGVRNHRGAMEVIRAETPQIVALQEVDSATARSGRTFLARELADSLGMHATFARAIPYDGGAYGIALLSAEKPLTVTRLPLPGREEARVLLVAEFPKFVMLCTHLSLNPDDRLTSAGIINDVAKRYSDRPVFLAGDLNATPDSPEIRCLLETYTLVSSSLPTFPADSPEDRIDHILVKTGTARASHAYVPATPSQSDHRPTVVTLTF